MLKQVMEQRLKELEDEYGLKADDIAKQIEELKVIEGRITELKFLINEVSEKPIEEAPVPAKRGRKKKTDDSETAGYPEPSPEDMKKYVDRVTAFVMQGRDKTTDEILRGCKLNMRLFNLVVARGQISPVPDNPGLWTLA